MLPMQPNPYSDPHPNPNPDTYSYSYSDTDSDSHPNSVLFAQPDSNPYV